MWGNGRCPWGPSNRLQRKRRPYFPLQCCARRYLCCCSVCHTSSHQRSLEPYPRFKLQASRHPPPHLEPGMPGSPGCAHYFTPTAKDRGRSCPHPGHALDVGVSRKLGSHLSDCRSVGMDFIPLVAETLGGLAEDTIRMTRAIGKALGKRTNPDDPSTSTKHLFGCRAIALWRGNACCWIHRTPLTHPSLDGLI